MKKLTVIALLISGLLFYSAWAGGQEEKKAAPKMEKIVYLAVEYNDHPEVLPAWAAEFKRITGVDVKLKTVSSKNASDLMMAQFMAGELPDVVKYGADNLNTIVRQGYIIPLDKFIENSPKMKKLKELYPSSFKAHSVDGVVYGIPAMVGAQRGLWVRTDLLKKLGLPMPKTLDEFVATLKAMRDNLKGPGGKPMYPLISKTYHDGYLPAVIGNYFNVSILPAVKRPNDRKYREGWDSPQFKDYAEFIKMLFDEKLIDPDHALPQKASKTRSKFYAGKGAFLIMWVYRYQEMVSEIRKNFPKAEIALVPPIENPKTGNVIGLSVVPGYRPFCITSKAKDPQFVWDKFIDTLYFNPDGAMLFNRGIPNVSYKIVNNTFVDNFKESGIHMGVRAPMDPDIKFPYKLPALMEKGQQIETQFSSWFSKYDTEVVFETPNKSVPEFDAIRKDMKDKKNQLFWKYVLGEFSFDDMLKKFKAYKREVDFDSILKTINGD